MLIALPRLICLLAFVACLTACAPLLTMMGTTGSAVQFAAQLDRVKLIADGISYVNSKKTISDHALSLAAGADCRILNVVAGNPVCASQNREVAKDEHHSSEMEPATGTQDLHRVAALPAVPETDTEPAN